MRVNLMECFHARVMKECLQQTFINSALQLATSCYSRKIDKRKIPHHERIHA